MANMIMNRIRIEGTVERLKAFLKGLYVDVSKWEEYDGRVRPSFSAYVPFPKGKEGDFDWADQNWGTTWDLDEDSEYDIDELLKKLNRKRKGDRLTIVEFFQQTSDSAPIEFFLRVSIQFSDLVFEITSSDEGDWTIKRRVIQQGIITDEDTVENRIESWKLRLKKSPGETQEEMLELFWDNLINEVKDFPTEEEMFSYAPIYFEDLYTEENIPWDSDDNRITKEMLENTYPYSEL